MSGFRARDPEAAEIRAAYFDEDRAQTRFVMVLVAVLTLAFIPLEWLRFAGEPLHAALLAVRLSVVLVVGALAFVAARATTPARLDRSHRLLFGLGLPQLFVINLLYEAHFATDLLIVIGLYLGIPARFRLQVVAASLLSGVDLWIDLFVMSFPDLNDPFANHLFAHALGFSLRRRQLRRRRELFDTRAEESRANRELEAALADVRRLSGLLPICAVCKKIRDEEDTWQPLERYIDARSEARFTHSYCPECEAELAREASDPPARV